ncbi:F0F1 ATP synthase subunit A [Aequorivita lipolytica]|uniref:ATP synthase subunit a n=1 Tax=Aequorivita lipolytica TaxID=153267 RepID=A0A5C6YSC5_9FLAO|nr:F0F1 ATP synthase subunit A [Aequorivita lipolytica]TXD70308.1 F0F1 ATP synthase subunit A [Aequorivita lipolytica]SRX50736.1 ATP synthase subunit a [Aequorivita lipolytica]
MKISFYSIKFFGLLFSFLLTLNGFANEGSDNASQGDERINTENEIKEYIQHHIKDAHDFHLVSYTNDAGERVHVGFPLPVILYGRDGITTFMSSEFHHDTEGKVVVEKNGSRFVNYHSKIYELENGASEVAFDADKHPVNASRPLDLSISKSVFGILVIGLLMLWWFSSLARQYKKRSIPKGFGRVLEPLVIYVRDEIAKPNIGEKKYRKFTGYLMTVFFFIWFLNILGLTPLGFNVTGQIAVTAALAIFTLIIYTVSGNRDYWIHMIWMPGVPILIRPVLALIELLGAFVIKPFSLLVRLFANISAGHIIVMSLVAIMITLKSEMTVFGSTTLSFVLALFITVIELLVAFLQAYIFTMLSALFIGMAVAEHDHEHDSDGTHELSDAEDVRADFI